MREKREKKILPVKNKYSYSYIIKLFHLKCVYLLIKENCFPSRKIIRFYCFPSRKIIRFLILIELTALYICITQLCIEFIYSSIQSGALNLLHVFFIRTLKLMEAL